MFSLKVILANIVKYHKRVLRAKVIKLNENFKTIAHILKKMY